MLPKRYTVYSCFSFGMSCFVILKALQNMRSNRTRTRGIKKRPEEDRTLFGRQIETIYEHCVWVFYIVGVCCFVKHLKLKTRKRASKKRLCEHFTIRNRFHLNVIVRMKQFCCKQLLHALMTNYRVAANGPIFNVFSKIWHLMAAKNRNNRGDNKQCITCQRTKSICHPLIHPSIMALTINKNAGFPSRWLFGGMFTALSPQTACSFWEPLIIFIKSCI